MTINSFDQFQDRFSFNSTETLDNDNTQSIFKGIDTTNGEYVALKRKHSILAKEKYSLFQEFITAKKLSHPNLLAHLMTYRFDLPSGILDYGVMEYANGGNLYQFIKNNELSSEQKNEILFGVLNGLQQLHDQGIVYGKLHPGNILIHQKNEKLIPKLIGYGKSIDAKSDSSILENERYTIAFLSPEQINKKKWSVATDFWAFGVLIYWLFTSEMIFGSRTKDQSIFQISNAITVAALPTKLIKIPEPYQTLIGDCLEINQKESIHSIEELIWRLERDDILFIADDPIINFEFTEAEPLENIPFTNQKYKATPTLKKKAKKVISCLVFSSILLTGIAFFFPTKSKEKAKPVAAVSSISNDPELTTVVTGKPAIKFDHESFDFGYVEEHETTKHTFRYTNVGDAPLTIRKTINKRGFNVPNSENWVELPPGKSGKVVVSVRPYHELLHNRSTVEIHTNASRKPIILNVEYRLKTEGYIGGDFIEEGDEINIRNSPSLEGDIIYQMTDGEVFDILETDTYDQVEKFGTNVWHKITTSKGDGWILSAFVVRN